MIAVDTNVLVYAHRQDSPLHDAAKAQLSQLAQAQAPWAIAWPCLHEFFAIATHPRIYSPPTTPSRASAQVRAWLDSPSLIVIGETPLHWDRLESLVAHGSVVGPAIHDARIAAICIDQGITEILTQDRDFERFAGLRVRRLAT